MNHSTDFITADLFCGGTDMCFATKRVGVVRYTCAYKRGHDHGHSDGKSCSWYDDAGTWLTHEEIVRRWPRLLAAMQWCLIGTQSEATDAVNGLLSQFSGGSEAVVHFGGAKRVFHAAVKARHSLRKHIPSALHRYIKEGAAT